MLAKSSAWRDYSGWGGGRFTGEEQEEGRGLNMRHARSLGVPHAVDIRYKEVGGCRGLKYKNVNCSPNMHPTAMPILKSVTGVTYVKK